MGWQQNYFHGTPYFRQELEQPRESEKLSLEGDIVGGLILERQIYFLKDEPKIFGINSTIVARNVDAGFGAFSRLVCLQLHPTFNLPHPTESYVSFIAIDRSNYEI
ncbi:uncharacterized protein [Henckelia pumila]|uniref:uncharacterized protein n=1 Tax=Henckelia pumila TaxID=405737 RepID=UPI003C6E034D